MTEHEIRLRAAWEGTFHDGSRRVDLPIRWKPRDERPSVLSRRFQMPRLDSPRERLFLRLANIPGLTEIRLDGRPLLATRPRAERLELELPADSPASHCLELVLGGVISPDDDSASEEWGHVVLVIRAENGTATVGEDRAESL